MPRMLERADDVLSDLWWGDAPRRVRESGWTPSTATRGSDPEDYRNVAPAVAQAVAQAEAAGTAAGKQAATSGSPSAGASNSPPSKPPPPQGDNSYAGQGNYTYRVDPATGDIFILQSGYGGKVTDYSAAPKKVARGSSAYNAIVAELNQMHNLSLRPVQAARPAGQGQGQGQGAKPPPPPPPPPSPPKNEAPPRTGPAPAGDAWFNMEADAATRPSAASAVDAWFNMEGDASRPAQADPLLANQPARQQIPSHPVADFLEELPDVTYPQNQKGEFDGDGYILSVLRNNPSKRAGVQQRLPARLQGLPLNEAIPQLSFGERAYIENYVDMP